MLLYMAAPPGPNVISLVASARGPTDSVDEGEGRGCISDAAKSGQHDQNGLGTDRDTTAPY